MIDQEISVPIEKAALNSVRLFLYDGLGIVRRSYQLRRLSPIKMSTKQILTVVFNIVFCLMFITGMALGGSVLFFPVIRDQLVVALNVWTGSIIALLFGFVGFLIWTRNAT